jgi:hypothetical protein
MVAIFDQMVEHRWMLMFPTQLALKGLDQLMYLKDPSHFKDE